MQCLHSGQKFKSSVIEGLIYCIDCGQPIDPKSQQLEADSAPKDLILPGNGLRAIINNRDGTKWLEYLVMWEKKRYVGSVSCYYNARLDGKLYTDGWKAERARGSVVETRGVLTAKEGLKWVQE